MRKSQYKELVPTFACVINIARTYPGGCAPKRIWYKLKLLLYINHNSITHFLACLGVYWFCAVPVHINHNLVIHFSDGLGVCWACAVYINHNLVIHFSDGLSVYWVWVKYINYISVAHGNDRLGVYWRSEWYISIIFRWHIAPTAWVCIGGLNDVQQP